MVRYHRIMLTKYCLLYTHHRAMVKSTYWGRLTRHAWQQYHRQARVVTPLAGEELSRRMHHDGFH